MTSVRARKAAGGSTRCFRWAAEPLVTATRVVLAEDQPMVRAGFRSLLDSRNPEFRSS